MHLQLLPRQLFWSSSTWYQPIPVVLFPSHVPIEGLQQIDRDRVEVLDLSFPRKLLLWVYTLVHGRYSNISAVVKYCEEHATVLKTILYHLFRKCIQLSSNHLCAVSAVEDEKSSDIIACFTSQHIHGCCSSRLFTSFFLHFSHVWFLLFRVMLIHA